MSEDGFEYQSTFYRWHLTDLGKDLMLIDRITGLSLTEFHDLIDDIDVDAGRTPVMLTMIATSIRNRHPAWTVDRIMRLVENMSIADVTFVGGDEDTVPLADETTPTDEPSRSASNGSSPSSTPPEPSTSSTSSETPPSSTSPGSPTTTPESPSPSSNRATGL